MTLAHQSLDSKHCLIFCLISSAIESYAKLKISSNNMHCLWFIWMLSLNTIKAFKLPNVSPICRNCSINSLS
ncbi:hypothetical protein SLE2022_029360 [Rubroshorea leprosula]